MTTQDARATAASHYQAGERALANCREHTGSMGVEDATFHAMLAIAHFAAGQLALALGTAVTSPPAGETSRPG
jgi:hypothetical protein